MDAVFRALASETRRRILDIVKNRPGSNVNDVCASFETSRIAVMKHLRVLEEAQLVLSEKVGRERRLHHNAVPIQMIYDRWTTQYSALWASRVTGIKYRVESAAPARGRARRAKRRKGRNRRGS
jgi:DNA-binding transcriptional ArsR family regulator